MKIENKMRNEIYSATSLMNYIRNDGVIDYIKLKERGKHRMDIYRDMSDMKRQKTDDKRYNNSFEYIMEMGNNFEREIMEEIKNKTEREKIIKIESDNLTVSEHNGITEEIIKKDRYEIIMNGLIINLDNRTYGKPDIIVKGGWLRRNIRNRIPEDVEDELYYIIDVKCSNINLINGEENRNKIVTNSVEMDGYKIQILVYTKGLERIIKREIRYGFILGKRYKDSRREYGSFENIGVIDYRNKKMEEKINKTVEWKDWIGREYEKIGVNDIREKKIVELFPNMKNNYDINYYGKKLKIAKEIREITLIWNCGIKQRNNAIENGIYFMDDKKLEPEKLGIDESSKKYNIIDKIIEINRNNRNKENIENIYLDENNNVKEWRRKMKYEYYVDFEMYNNEKNRELVLYMIGVMYNNNYNVYIIDNEGIDNNINKRIKDKKIRMNIIRCKDEREVIERFKRYINSGKKEEVRLYHWSKCEPNTYKNKIKKYGIEKEDKIEWIDMLEIFKDEEYPIIVRETYNFSLKSIVRKMDEYGMIEVKWEDNLQDGLLSAFMAREVYENKKNMEIDFGSIIRYNMIDCLALREILRYIREYKNIKN